MFISVVPAVRTIPGVEEFDYAVDDGADVRVGDLLRVPFRKRMIPALVIARTQDSPYAEKALRLTETAPLLRLGSVCADLLIQSAARTFVSKPTVCSAWIRSVPKRAQPVALTHAAQDASQRSLPERTTKFLIRRWHAPDGLFATARGRHGKTLILTPWQHRASLLAQELDVPVLHADLADGAAWKAVHDFCEAGTTLVTTRIGAWLACIADTVIIDEPENDDLKQDELSPRLDARWIVERCAAQRPELSVIAFSTTPRLSSPGPEWRRTPQIELALETEIRQRRGSSDIEGLSARVVDEVSQAIDTRTPVTIIHAVSGERARAACRDCGWTATCVACRYPLSSIGSGKGLCRHCGHIQQLPASCPSCGGTDLARSAIGKDRLAESIRARFASDLVRVVTPSELQTLTLPRNGLVILTDATLLGGAAEDTRRRERLVISWRRIAAVFSSTNSRVIAQGSEETLADCRSWLTTQGVVDTWIKEIDERRTFGYPPAHRLIKLLIDGTEHEAADVASDLKTSIDASWKIQGPFPVPFRPVSRRPRWVIQLLTPISVSDPELERLLNPFRTRAIIDLDPIAFFA